MDVAVELVTLAEERARTISPESVAADLASEGSSLESMDAGGMRTEFPDSDARDSDGLLVRPPSLAAEIFHDTGLDADTEEWIAQRDRIEEAMVTYAEEGLRVLKPLLAHPNARVRAEAMDAIMQMDVPGGGAVLREAAARATSASERRRLGEAADFCDLPTISAEDLRRFVLRLPMEAEPVAR